jgi:carbamoylphosphate synthase large subunit
VKLQRQVIVHAAFTLGGKGVVVCDTAEELIDAITSCMALSPVAEVSVREIHVGSEEHVVQMERIREWELEWERA